MLDVKQQTMFFVHTLTNWVLTLQSHLDRISWLHHQAVYVTVHCNFCHDEPSKELLVLMRLSCSHTGLCSRAGCNDVLVVLGGFGNQQMPVDTVEKFDPKTQEWQPLPVCSYAFTLSFTDCSLF